MQTSQAVIELGRGHSERGRARGIHAIMPSGKLRSKERKLFFLPFVFTYELHTVNRDKLISTKILYPQVSDRGAVVTSFHISY